MRTCLVAAALIATAATAAQAETLHFHAALAAGNEVPTNSSNGVGLGNITLDTNTKALTYSIGYMDLSGPATAAHFHGPAGPGMNAGPVVTIMDLKNPMTGKATLTDAQIADLKAGKWYVNIHTMANPRGEIRGQVLPGS